MKTKAPRNVWPFIKQRAYGNGTLGWQVDARTKDGGERRTFPTKTEAETFAHLQRVKRQNEGDSAFALPAADRIDAETALGILKPHGRTLREAAEFFLKHIHVVTREMTVEELVAELLASKAKDGASVRYLKDLRTRLQIFARALSGQKVAEISRPAIDDWLRALPHSPVTRNNYRRLLGVLFGYAVRRGYCITNPTLHSAKAKVIDRPAGILSADQSARLLEAAAPDILPAIALGMFAGLRPEAEIWLLDWRNIDFESRLIDVAADRTKTAQSRYVKMNDNLIAWLMPLRKASGAVTPTGDGYFTRLQKARDAAGIKTWPGDCLRHTFGSMHYAHHQNIGETMAEMGHTNPRTFIKHYRERVKPAEAKRFWQIMPCDVSRKIVAMG